MSEPPVDQLTRFLELLDTRCRYAIVKNADLWANLRRGGDWDIVVSDVPAAQSALVESVGPPRRVSRRSYVVGHFYDWGQIDLLPRLDWHGVELVHTRRFLDRAAPDDEGWRVACIAHQAMMGWVGPLLASGRYKPRYDALVLDALTEDPGELGLLLNRLFGPALATELQQAVASGPASASQPPVARLRDAARRRAFTRRLGRTVASTLSFGYREALLRLAPALPFVALDSEERLDTATSWCATRHRVVPGLAFFDGRQVRMFPAAELGARSAHDRFAERVQDSGRGSLGVELRAQLAGLQARGWLTASLVETGGVGTSQSTLVGLPWRAPGDDLGATLDAYLARRTAAALGNPHT